MDEETPTLHPAIELMIDEALEKLADASAIVMTAAAAVKLVYDVESIGNPDIVRTLKLASSMLNDVYGQLIPSDMADRVTDKQVLERLEARQLERDPEYRDRMQAAEAYERQQRSL